VPVKPTIRRVYEVECPICPGLLGYESTRTGALEVWKDHTRNPYHIEQVALIESEGRSSVASPKGA
jgi:hypothetical protein